jgi:uncharacterized protein YcfJ
MRWHYLALLASLAATSVSAQRADSIRAGARVRVWETQADAPSVELVARVQSTDAQAITLDAPAGPIVVPWPRVSHMDVSGGPRSGPRWRSGLIGGLAGAIGGGLLGVIIGDATNHNAPKFGAAGIVAGGALGAVIGTTQPGERWMPINSTNDTRS